MSKKIETRKLNNSSWLAQSIQDKMDFAVCGSVKYNNLQTLLVIVQEADDNKNGNIYYTNHNNNRQIVICNIPDLSKHGSDFNQYKMQCRLLGLAESCRDDEGNYIVNVLTTHDLNSATINDISELLYQIGNN